MGERWRVRCLCGNVVGDGDCDLGEGLFGDSGGDSYEEIDGERSVHFMRDRALDDDEQLVLYAIEE